MKYYLILLLLFMTGTILPQRHPYASNQLIPLPVHFYIPGSVQAWHITFEPDGNTFYYLADSSGFYEIIKSSHFENDKWSYPKLTGFSGVVHEETPHVSPDGKKFFFAKNLTPGMHDNEDIFVMEKTDSGWTEPFNLGASINTSRFEASPSTASNGNLYFLSERSGGIKIYRAVWNGSGYNEPEMLSNNINRFSVAELYIAPDESYILFGRNMSGTNWGDIYISFRNSNNSWTLSKSLGPKINTPVWEGRPCISPDGNYLFFSRGGDWNTNPWQIYQVDWKPMLDSLRNVCRPTDVEEGAVEPQTPDKFSLKQNYPNPFNPTTHFEFRISNFEFVKINVYDFLGNEIATLVNEEKKPGIYNVEWNADKYSSGIYFYSIQAGDFSSAKKMILLK